MSNRVKWLLIGLLLIAAFLRLNGLFHNTFQADEALFATWARLIAIWRDPLLKSQLVDKPPLLFYLQAIFYPVFGPVEWAARLPNLLASILLIPSTAVLVWKLFRQGTTAFLAAALVALSPLAIQYSATAFTDPLLTFLLVIALGAIAAVKPSVIYRKHGLENSKLRYALLGGIFFGLAIATKFQAWLFLPLMVGLAWLLDWGRQAWVRWLVGIAACLAFLLVWESARSGSLTLLDAQVNSIGGFRMTWSWELWPRLAAWGEYGPFIIGPPIWGIVTLMVMAAILAWLIDEPERLNQIDQLFILFLTGYFAFHWLVAIPVWDRYLLPVVPIVAIVIARGIVRFFGIILKFYKREPTITMPIPMLVGLLLVIFTLWQAEMLLAAYNGMLPIGGRPQADMGTGSIAAQLVDESYGTVLYDHWYSWQWHYHLLDSGVFVSWFPGPKELVEDLNVFANGSDQRYIALPVGDEAKPVIRALNEGGYTLLEIPSVLTEDRTQMIKLYEIIRNAEE